MMNIILRHYDEGTFQPVFRDHPCVSGIEDLKYSPDDTRLAVASR
jgi:hypothetical protein